MTVTDAIALGVSHSPRAPHSTPLPPRTSPAPVPASGARSLRLRYALLVCLGLGLVLAPAAFALPYKPGTYGLGAVKVQRGKFTVRRLMMRETCTPKPPMAIDFSIGLRGSQAVLRGRISRAGKLKGNGKLDGRQTVSGSVKSKHLNLTVTDKGSVTQDGVRYTCHGKGTWHFTRDGANQAPPSR